MRDGAGLLSEVRSVFCGEPSGRVPRFGKEPIRRGDYGIAYLRALFLEDDLGLACGQLFLADGAGYVTERRGRREHGAELPQRPLTLGVRVGLAADQGAFLGHIVMVGVLDVFGNVDHLGLAGDRPGGLSEGGGGTENEQGEKSDFHGVFSRLRWEWLHPRYQFKELSF